MDPMNDGIDGDDDDRISKLPDDVLHRIFSFLETYEVVRTLVLSKRWRNLWTSNPSLNFEESFRSFNGGKFIDFVNSVLNLRDDSDILKFYVNCNSSEWIGRWIQILVRRNIQELELICPHDLFTLPVCLGNANSLVTLKLGLCCSDIKIPSGLCFRMLTSLHLILVRFANDAEMPRLLSGCPLLETLKLELCGYCFLKVLDITAPKLKNLSIDSFDKGHQNAGLRATTLKVVAPNLISFEYLGPMARDYNLQEMSSVIFVFIQLNHGFEEEEEEEEGDEEEEEEEVGAAEKKLGYITCKIVGSFRNAEVMKLSDPLFVHVCYVLNTPECFPNLFYYLKDLKVLLGSTKWHLEAIFRLLKYSPNLESLAIDFIEMFEWVDGGDWQAQDEANTCLMKMLDRDDGGDRQAQDEAGTCLMNHLKVVEISGDAEGSDPLGYKNVPMLIKFLLENGGVLTKVIVYSSRDAEIIQMVQTFPKASPNVDITFNADGGWRIFLKMYPTR